MSSLIILLVSYFPALIDLIIVHMVLVQKRERGLCHNALVTTHDCSVMVLVSHVDMTFSWMVSTPVFL
jgi:hypothetical protein